MGDNNTPSPGSQTVDSSRELDDPTAPCPLKECGITVWCSGATDSKALKDVDVKVTPSGASKPTDDNGTAEFEHLKPPNQDYTVTVTLKGSNAEDYYWDDEDGGNATPDQLTKNVAGGAIELYIFDALKLAHPKIQLTWEADGAAVKDVAVKLKGGKPKSGEKSFTKTDPSGLSNVPSGEPGLRPDSYTVTFPSGLEHCEIKDVENNAPQIDVEAASTKTFPFVVRKYYIKFQVKDQFGDAVSAAGYLLTYPKGKDPESGNLEETGLVEKDQVPKGDHTFAVKTIYGLSWGAAGEAGATKLTVGTAGKLSAKLSGFANGTDVTFQIFDACKPSGEPLDTATGKVKGDTSAEADWTPDAGKLKDVKSGRLVFVAKVDSQQEISAPVPIEAKQTFQVTGPDSHPLATSLVLKFTGGLEIPGNSENGKLEAAVPLGQTLLSIGLPDQQGAPGTYKPPGGAESAFRVPKTS